MDQKTILVSLVIAVVAATVFFNFDEFTGQAGNLNVLQNSLKSLPKGSIPGSVEVKPEVVNAGEYIQITIKPGDVCINKEVSVYKVGRTLPVVKFRKTIRNEGYSASSARYCKEITVNYKTGTSWEGDYYVQVKEIPLKANAKLGDMVYYTDSFKVNKAGRSPSIINK